MVVDSESDGLITMMDGPDADEVAVVVSSTRDASFSHEGLMWLSQQLVSAGVTDYRLLSRDSVMLARHFLLEDAPDFHQVALLELFEKLNIEAGDWTTELASIALPAVALIPDHGYAFVYAAGGPGEWLVETHTGRRQFGSWPAGTLFLPASPARKKATLQTAEELFETILGKDRAWVPLAAVATTLSSILLLATSLYSMQVYDRVIGQGGLSTLIVLTVGVVIAIVVELGLKLARSAIMDRAINAIDVDASVSVYARLLSVRLDQMPPSLGTLAAQVRGFETVRAFALARIIYLATDLPFAVFFLLIIWMIGGFAVAMVPAIAFVIAVAGGLSLRRAIARHATNEMSVTNMRQGVLVETIQSAESMKAAGAGWLLQGRWNSLSRESANESMKLKQLNDHAAHFSSLMQQLSYVLLVATGAYLAVDGRTMTVGAIIACSIISGRVLGPVAALPGLLVQWGNSKIALDHLEKLFELERDNHGILQPLSPAFVQGKLEVRNVEFAWRGQTTPFALNGFTVQPGERVGVIGSVGSGKSTLLKLFVGVIKASKGVVCLDGMDVQHIAADRRSELIGYLPQTTRLISGTLRQNLTLGLPYVAEDVLMAAIQTTGLAEQIAGRPEGLDVRISEGGEGLSGGQKQLVALTRLLLCQSSLWLLDEPTSSMDEGTEERCLMALKRHVRSGQTLVVVTHKARLLDLVDRLVVLTPQGIALDGPKDKVLDALRQRAAAAQQQQGGIVTTGSNLRSSV
ncbi:MAG: ATP-binding cassette domain-containing protein [Sphingomonadaceae bacterium]|nr:ATP-binding cassette domain-containing protein [Sphingomonadaceae bacterium]MBJ7388487.1 ATP-binding cassette domain-containing protein [Sphingomonadaceae bacterium]